MTELNKKTMDINDEIDMQDLKYKVKELQEKNEELQVELDITKEQLILSGVVQQSELYTCDCKVCGKPFGDKLSLYEHYDEEHN
jgi:hypothetical protein